MIIEDGATASEKTAVVLIGSPKSGPSASSTLGSALADRLTRHGYATEMINVTKALKTGGCARGIVQQMDAAQIMVVSSPLYADGLPAPLLRAFELFVEHRASVAVPCGGGQSKGGTPPRDQRLVALVNCGFPEAQQCATALAICRLFARDAGVHWLGGLAFGMGGAIPGRPLERGPHARSAVPALDLVARSVVDDLAIPSEAAAMAGKRALPRPLYSAMVNLGWYLQARGKTGGRSLKHRPYAAAIQAERRGRA